METVPLPPIVSTQHVFHDLMSCIIEQQIHYRSTKNIFQKMLLAAGLEILTPDNFPLLEERGLSEVKLSGSKYETLLQTLDLFRAAPQHWAQLEDQTIRKKLVSIKGISNWTVDMLLLYTLEREDIFPADDYHLRQIMTKLYGIGPEAKLTTTMKAIAAPWSPHRSLAVKYLFAWKDFYKKK